jgi:two-component system, OmpR family, phosphate regulon sensor histidine kinase PhoR
MLTFNTVILLFNGLTLALALGFLLIILWHDSRKVLNQFFAIFLLLVALWNASSFLLQVSFLVADSPELVQIAVSGLELGFTGSSVGIYILTTVLIGSYTRWFRLLALASLAAIILYRILLIVSSTAPAITLGANAGGAYQITPLFVLFYLAFDGATLFLLWRYRRRLRSRGVVIGICIFLAGQSLTFLNPTLIVASFSTSISAVGALLLSFAIIQREIISPLGERLSQIETMHRVSLAVTSQIAIDTVLNEIAHQAVGWLNADGVGIFLTESKGSARLRLATVHNLPQQYLNMEIPPGHGVAGTVAQTQQTIFLENYIRDWNEADDLPLARETFGSVICVPLNYANDIIGVLMVICGRHGRLLDSQDVYLLELLSAQAAVAIAHSHLFAEQQQLTAEVEAAHSQLETVLTSTESPVIAVDRGLRLIFANLAARALFSLDQDRGIDQTIPREAFPRDLRSVVRAIRHKNSYVYEVSIKDKVYLCHLAALGSGRLLGWVAVLNEITQLKELDRLKSEMVRMASHDLKNPLMGAMAYLDLLEEDIALLNVPSLQESVDKISWQLERMNRIIRGILDLERIRMTAAASEICDPGIITRNAVAELEQFVAGKHVELEVIIHDDVPAFVGDRDQFERVLINLLENAIKFTMGDGKVRVEVREYEGKVLFEIRDNGVGIPASVQPYVFDRFFRGQQKGVEHVTGSGLGLSLAKTIVENHNGEIWLQSEENKGTTFFISIPAAE